MAPKRSGRWVIAAPMSKPPLERPRIASLSAVVYLLAIRYSAAAKKSSNTFCFFSNIPPLCQFSPYSPPPRRLGCAQNPPCSIHHTHSGFHFAPRLMLNPPYATISAGAFPFAFTPFFDEINIGTRVPSLDV